MRVSLDKICDLLNSFEKEIAQVEEIWNGSAKRDSELETVFQKNWQEKYHRMWLHGATEEYECNELERWLTDYDLLPRTIPQLS